MESVLHRIPKAALEGLAREFSSGRIQPPYSTLSISDFIAAAVRPSVAAELNRLASCGMKPAQIAIVMELLAAERARQQSDHDRIQMVWTGPDQDECSVRDTSVVARELLSQAKASLLITTFSISKDSTTFEPVAEAMERNPKLDVTVVLDIDMSQNSLFGPQAAAAFARGFWTKKWPWHTRPKVYYDPRGVDPNPLARARQHSKCIVADLERVLITSANYTESGQLRNIELGVVIRDQTLAARVDNQFRTLITNNLLLPLNP